MDGAESHSGPWTDWFLAWAGPGLCFSEQVIGVPPPAIMLWDPSCVSEDKLFYHITCKFIQQFLNRTEAKIWRSLCLKPFVFLLREGEESAKQLSCFNRFSLSANRFCYLKCEKWEISHGRNHFILANTPLDLWNNLFSIWLLVL